MLKLRTSRNGKDLNRHHLLLTIQIQALTWKTESFLEFKLVEILSILLSLVALLVSSCSVKRTAAHKHDEKRIPLYLDELQGRRSTSELNVALPTQISRHKSRLNIEL